MSIIIPFNQSLLPLKINLLINHHKTINNKINNIKKGIKILIHFPFIINPHLIKLNKGDIKKVTHII